MKRRLTYFILITGMLLLSGCAQFQTHQRAGKPDVESLHNAIITDDVRYVRSAIESGAISPNQNIPAPSYMEGTPLLTIAARAASLDVMQYLISVRANLNARTPVDETPLMLAAYFYDDEQNPVSTSNPRHEKAVRMLVEAGADVENGPDSYTPLSYAAYQGNDQIVRYLIVHGARPNADAVNGETFINTPLMMASIQGHRSTALKLLDAGADARIRVWGGNTAVEFAEKYRHTHMIPMLRCAESLAQHETFRQKCGTSNFVSR